MVTRRRRAALVSALVLLLGVVVSGSGPVRDLVLWKGEPQAWERSGKCVLGVWGRITEETWLGHLVVRAGVVAPRSCEPVEIRVEATLWHEGESYQLSAMPGRANATLGRWKVLPLTGPQDLKRGSVWADLDHRRVPGRLRFGDVVRVLVKARCKHGTTVESEAWYWYR